MNGILLACGLVLAALAGWRGYGAARRAIRPLVHDGEPTRTLIDDRRPPYARARVRAVAREVAVSIGWIALAMYGLFLVAAAGTAGS